MTQWPSSLTLTHELASSKPKSCRSSTRFANSGSCLRLRLRCRINQSGSGRAVEDPAIVYTGTAEFVESFIAASWVDDVLRVLYFARLSVSEPRLLFSMIRSDNGLFLSNAIQGYKTARSIVGLLSARRDAQTRWQRKFTSFFCGSLLHTEQGSRTLKATGKERWTDAHTYLPHHRIVLPLVRHRSILCRCLAQLRRESPFHQKI